MKQTSNLCLSTRCTSYDLSEATKEITLYSPDGRRLLKVLLAGAHFSVPYGVEAICDDAFHGCNMIESVELPESLIYIGNGAFFGCSSLQDIFLPDSIEAIGDYAFSGCRSINHINLPDGIKEIGHSAFSNCAMRIKSESSCFASDGVCLVDIGAHELLSCHNNTIVDYRVPESVITICERAFWGCRHLENVSLSDTVTHIGSGAFCSCSSLSTITMTASVESVGDGAFWNCDQLAEIIVPVGTAHKFEALLGHNRRNLLVEQ